MAQDTLLGFPVHTLPYRHGEFTTSIDSHPPACVETQAGVDVWSA